MSVPMPVRTTYAAISVFRTMPVVPKAVLAEASSTLAEHDADDGGCSHHRDKAEPGYVPPRTRRRQEVLLLEVEYHDLQECPDDSAEHDREGRRSDHEKRPRCDAACLLLTKAAGHMRAVEQARPPCVTSSIALARASDNAWNY